MSAHTRAHIKNTNRHTQSAQKDTTYESTNKGGGEDKEKRKGSWRKEWCGRTKRERVRVGGLTHTMRRRIQSDPTPHRPKKYDRAAWETRTQTHIDKARQLSGRGIQEHSWYGINLT